MICKNCNASISDNSKFCNQCGQQVEITCKNCANILSEDSKFCNQCGTELASNLNPSKKGRLYGREVSNYIPAANYGLNITKFKDKLYYIKGSNLYQVNEDMSDEFLIFQDLDDFDVNGNGIFVFKYNYSPDKNLLLNVKLLDFNFQEILEKSVPSSKNPDYLDEYVKICSSYNYKIFYEQVRLLNDSKETQESQLMCLDLKKDRIDILIDSCESIKHVWANDKKALVYHTISSADSGEKSDRLLSIDLENKNKKEIYLYYDENHKAYASDEAFKLDEEGIPLQEYLKKIKILSVDIEADLVYFDTSKLGHEAPSISRNNIQSNLLIDIYKKLLDIASLRGHITSFLNKYHSYNQDHLNSALSELDSNLRNKTRIESFDGRNVIIHYEISNHNFCMKFAHDIKTGESIMIFKNAEGLDPYAILVDKYVYHSSYNGKRRIKLEEGANEERF